ncbi:MAG TPA: AzlD domain-containing protein [Bacillota bacterium]|nr:AzlD domain-containing protein [Bacillota bacterium]
MKLTYTQALITILVVVLGTMITRVLPFLLLRGSRSNSPFINYLSKVLPYSAIGFLVVFCLKDVSLGPPTFAGPEIISIVTIVVLHYWKENTLLSIGLGTALYMVLVQLVFV